MCLSVFMQCTQCQLCHLVTKQLSVIYATNSSYDVIISNSCCNDLWNTLFWLNFPAGALAVVKNVSNITILKIVFDVVFLVPAICFNSSIDYKRMVYYDRFCLLVLLLFFIITSNKLFWLHTWNCDHNNYSNLISLYAKTNLLMLDPCFIVPSNINSKNTH